LRFRSSDGADGWLLMNDRIDGDLLFKTRSQRRLTFGAALFAMQNSV
jgi:hypothetical protein